MAISYLFRRLEENAADENFIHHLFSLEPGRAAFPPDPGADSTHSALATLVQPF